MYFAGRKELLEFATTAESYRRIVDDLGTGPAAPVQARDTGNRLVLAGPDRARRRSSFTASRTCSAFCGSRPRASSSSRSIDRLRSRSGGVSARWWATIVGVTVLTYHAMALRLTGASLGKLDEAGVEPDFDDLIRRAVDLLEGRSSVGADADELRDRLLRGYRFILVDEYQDIDALQYALVSALAGRTVREGEKKLSLLAVGDDDQNVYGFRKTSVEFIRRFRAGLPGRGDLPRRELPLDAAHHHRREPGDLAAPDRMKTDHPIRIDHVGRGCRPAAAGSASTRSAAAMCSSSACLEIATSRRSSR